MRKNKILKVVFVLALVITMLLGSVSVYADETDIQETEVYTTENETEETEVYTNETEETTEDVAALEETTEQQSGEETEVSDETSDSDNNDELVSGDSEAVIIPTEPVLKKAVNLSDGIKIKWSASENADSYRVYRRTVGKQWEMLIETTKTSFSDKSCVAGKAYYYTVRAVNSNGNLSSYSKKGILFIHVDTVPVSSVKNISKGIRVKWQTLNYASGYKVYRKVTDGKWEYIGSTTGSYFKDLECVSGKTYEYRVRAYVTYKKVKYYGCNETDSLKQITKLTSTKLLSVSSESYGIKVTWKKTTGAKEYIVYERLSGGTWVNAGTTTDTSFKFKKAEALKYTWFTVVPVDKYGNRGLYDKTGLVTVYVPEAAVTEVSNNPSNIKVNWDVVNKATGYMVYRKAGSGSWKKIATVTRSYYKDYSAKVANTKYKYKVKVYYKKGKVTYVSSSSSSKAKAVVWVNAPRIKSVDNSGTSSIIVKWKGVTEAAKYVLYRKTDSTDWVIAGTTTKKSFTDKNLESGVPYYYTVRAVNASGCYSGYYSGVMGLAGIRAAVAKDAQYYASINLPYVWAGRSLTTGTDCSGFVYLLYGQYKIYASPASLEYTDPAGYGFGTLISESELQPGDVVVYGNGSHVAIYIGNGKIAEEQDVGVGTVISSMSTAWRSPTGYVRISGT